MPILINPVRTPNFVARLQTFLDRRQYGVGVIVRGKGGDGAQAKYCRVNAISNNRNSGF